MDLDFDLEENINESLRESESSDLRSSRSKTSYERQKVELTDDDLLNKIMPKINGSTAMSMVSKESVAAKDKHMSMINARDQSSSNNPSLF